ncbi:membrane protein insertase YidC [Tomitella fengzijianii]|uniref:Membrane protein insertase YidC n=1 Tax=Tomitella fengzijianii TaxID=2597660 RepID=A0A516X727_9ACTN|nr:membrane protein insertase YidC [Tomitella fengzijianii]QDQ98878.1 membrane protein insertase YidC [Tomitella fengzijianii]
MLDFIYWPVSWIMRMWYKFFELVGLGSQSAITWVLSVVFLVFTLRVILYWPAVKQIRTTRQMQELQPQIKALQKKYKNDRQRMAVEMQKLQKEHGFNPLLGCLPMLAQAPVFIGLFHVLRSFNRTGGIGNVVNVCEDIPDPAQCASFNASLANYAFTPEDVNNFLHANIFGVPLSSYITQAEASFAGFFGFVDYPSRWQIAAVAVPLMVIAAIATHLNAKASVARQSPDAATQPQAKIMNKLAVYVFPLGVLVSGSFLPVAILIYWVSNNAWTVVQQHYVFKKITKEEEAKKERLEQVRADRAPKPGARPAQGKKGRAKGSAAVIDGTVVSDDDAGAAVGEAGSAEDDTTQSGTDAGGGVPQQAAKKKPGPGQKPNAQKGQQGKNRAGAQNRSGQGQKRHPQGQRPGGKGPQNKSGGGKKKRR